MFSGRKPGGSDGRVDILGRSCSKPTVGAAGGPIKALKSAGLNLSRLPEPRDPEYLLLKAAVDSLAEALHSVLEHWAAVDLAWTNLAASQDAVARTIAATDLAKDDLREYASSSRDFGKTVAALAPPVGKNATAVSALLLPGPDGRISAHTVGLQQVRRLLEHLRAIQARYRDVCKAKAEYESCCSKYRSSQQRHAGNANTANAQRYKERCDLSGKMYSAMLNRLKERMSAAVAKRDSAISLVSNSFWLQQARLHVEMGRHHQSSHDAGHATEPLLLSLNIMDGLSPPSTMFSALNPRSFPAVDMVDPMYNNFMAGTPEHSGSCDIPL